MYTIIIISIVAILILILGAFNQKKILLPIIYTGLVIALVVNFLNWNKSIHYFNEMYIEDNFSIAFNAVLIFTTILVLTLAPIYYKSIKKPLEDVYALLLFALIGALTMTAFGNLLMLFIGIETLSLALYILAGSKKNDYNSNEAAMKYFLTGSFASGFLVFGIALLYGSTGSLNLQDIYNYVNANSTNLPLMLKSGLFLVACGMTFKIGAAPFHFWTPDVYQGSPTIITTFMATVGKIAAIAAFYRLLNTCFVDAISDWTTTLSVFAIATILIGNLSALFQDNVKRMFAYSGIAHAGYMLIAIIILKSNAASVLLLYAVTYSVATIISFSSLIYVRQNTGSFNLEAFNGLARKKPLIAFSLAIALLSMAGIPPLAGFAAKYNLFVLAIEQGYIWLVAIAIIGSVISVYYYLKPILAMYVNKKSVSEDFETSNSYNILIGFFAIVLILLSVVPGLFINLI